MIKEQERELLLIVRSIVDSPAVGQRRSLPEWNDRGELVGLSVAFQIMLPSSSFIQRAKRLLGEIGARWPPAVDGGDV